MWKYACMPLRRRALISAIYTYLKFNRLLPFVFFEFASVHSSEVWTNSCHHNSVDLELLPFCLYYGITELTWFLAAGKTTDKIHHWQHIFFLQLCSHYIFNTKGLGSEEYFFAVKLAIAGLSKFLTFTDLVGLDTWIILWSLLRGNARTRVHELLLKTWGKFFQKRGKWRPVFWRITDQLTPCSSHPSKFLAMVQLTPRPKGIRMRGWVEQASGGGSRRINSPPGGELIMGWVDRLPFEGLLSSDNTDF